MNLSILKTLLLFTLAIAQLSIASSSRAENLWPDPKQMTQFVEDMKTRHGFDEATLTEMFAAIQPNTIVLQAIAPPTDPGVKSWQRYRLRFLTPQRIQGGIDFWEKHSETLTLAEKEYGVPASIMVAIVGVETEYGRNTGKFEVFEALATLAFAYPRRSDFFRRELEEFLLLARENNMPVRSIKGSYAGAIGIPQFMPGSQRRFAVDFDRDGKINLLGSPIDAIGSIGRFLNMHGWTKDAPIVSSLAPQTRIRDQWVSPGKPLLDEQGLVSEGLSKEQLPGNYPVALIDLVNHDRETEYWWGHMNFYVITRYNRSNFYAMSVAQLASSIEAQRKIKLAKRTKAGFREPRRPGG